MLDQIINDGTIKTSSCNLHNSSKVTPRSPEQKCTTGF